MICLTASVEDPNFTLWQRVNNVVMHNLTQDMQKTWQSHGYEGIAELCREYFGMHAFYRHIQRQVIVYEFTEQQWTMFVLRWNP